jgi:hypothetical protein
LAVDQGDWFRVDSVLQQVRLFQDLGFRPEVVTEAVTVLGARADQLGEDRAAWRPTRVIVFSGHTIDLPGTAVERFPYRKVVAARKAITDILDDVGLGPTTLAICGGADGGDTIFAELCAERGARVQLHVPMIAEAFARGIEDRAGPTWVTRFRRLRSTPNVSVHVLPSDSGNRPKGAGPQYADERNNLWQLHTAEVWLRPNVVEGEFITLWNGERGAEAGGTAHMNELMNDRPFFRHRIDPKDLT